MRLLAILSYRSYHTVIQDLILAQGDKMKKYYAVKKGRHPGIYSTWPEAQQQVQGFKGAIFKGFTELSAAQSFIKNNKSSLKAPETPEVLLYTDGGTRNTGNYAGGHVKSTDKAAWAYLIKSQNKHYQASAGQLGATNNQMELLAVVKGLEKLNTLNWTHKNILLVSDSQYVLNALTKGWLAGWQKRGWKKAEGQPVLNKDLWQQIYNQLSAFTNLQFAWTKGHAANVDNNFVDQLLNQTMDQM